MLITDSPRRNRAPVVIPADAWDRMADIADFFGGVAPVALYVEEWRHDPDPPCYRRITNRTPCCVLGVADAAELVDIYRCPLDSARGWLRALLHVGGFAFDKHIRDEQQARGLSSVARVPFEAVMARAGFARGEE